MSYKVGDNEMPPKRIQRLADGAARDVRRLRQQLKNVRGIQKEYLLDRIVFESFAEGWYKQILARGNK